MKKSPDSVLKHFVSIIAVAAIVFLTATTAAADEPDREWYGWQPMAADAIGTGVLSTGLAMDRKLILAAGAGIYLVNAPILHLFQGQWLNSAKSLGLRAGLPLVGWSVISLFARGDGEYAGIDAVAWRMGGFVVGMAAAMALDWAVVSWRDFDAPVDTQSQGLQLQWQFRF